MAIRRETVVHDGPGGPFEGVLAYDDEVETARPGVLVCPNVLGQKEADNVVAEKLAALGYVAFACDVFGQGRRAQRADADMARYMNEMLADRAQLRNRLAASLAVLTGNDRVLPAKVAAIGYCFGGLCVLDLARSGQPIVGGVSFHGVYGRPDYANVQPITAKLLVCHGWNDPLAPPDAVVGLAAELTEAEADWQLHAYGHAGHAFTDESARGSGMPGFGYNENADRRSWQAMQDLLRELFI
jgi:dienelactone hydrolase